MNTSGEMPADVDDNGVEFLSYGKDSQNQLFKGKGAEWMKFA